MRISDWSSDVCSSDLEGLDLDEVAPQYLPRRGGDGVARPGRECPREPAPHRAQIGHRHPDIEQLHRADRRTAAAAIAVRKRVERHPDPLEVGMAQDRKSAV